MSTKRSSLEERVVADYEGRTLGSHIPGLLECLGAAPSWYKQRSALQTRLLPKANQSVLFAVPRRLCDGK